MREISQIIVPANLVTQSRPSGHSVPLIRKRKKSNSRYRYPYRYLITALLVSVVAIAATATAFYYSDKMQRDAGYHLVCTQIVLSKTNPINCIWQKGAAGLVE
jgi:hypothetical protein